MWEQGEGSVSVFTPGSKSLCVCVFSLAGSFFCCSTHKNNHQAIQGLTCNMCFPWLVLRQIVPFCYDTHKTHPAAPAGASPPRCCCAPLPTYPLHPQIRKNRKSGTSTSQVLLTCVPTRRPRLRGSCRSTGQRGGRRCASLPAVLSHPQRRRRRLLRRGEEEGWWCGCAGWGVLGFCNAVVMFVPCEGLNQVFVS